MHVGITGITERAVKSGLTKSVAVLGNNRRQSPRCRLELGLGLSYRYQMNRREERSLESITNLTIFWLYLRFEHV